MTQVWQIGGGGYGRNYTQLFLDHDVMLRGPGDYGRFDEQKYRRQIRLHGETSRTIGGLRSFVEAPNPGDIVLLRSGHRVVAIGTAHEAGYTFKDMFDDVFGWHLGHARRVVWQRHLDTKLNEIQKRKDLFSERRQIPTFTAVRDRAILKRVEHLFSKCRERPLRHMPPEPPKPLDDDELGQQLFSEGISNESVDKVLVAIRRQRRLVRWYQTQRSVSWRPTEHEVVAHMILPLLLALGWSEQLLAVEWHSIDLACFSVTPTTNDKCVLICEAKWLGHGLQNVFGQATGYVKKLKLARCRKILTTDGARLYLYERQRGHWNDNPVGYLNVDLIRTNHVAPAKTNAVDTIVALTPARATREAHERL